MVNMGALNLHGPSVEHTGVQIGVVGDSRCRDGTSETPSMFRPPGRRAEL